MELSCKHRTLSGRIHRLASKIPLTYRGLFCSRRIFVLKVGGWGLALRDGIVHIIRNLLEFLYGHSLPSEVRRSTCSTCTVAACLVSKLPTWRCSTRQICSRALYVCLSLSRARACSLSLSRSLRFQPLPPIAAAARCSRAGTSPVFPPRGCAAAARHSRRRGQRRVQPPLPVRPQPRTAALQQPRKACGAPARSEGP